MKSNLVLPTFILIGTALIVVVMLLGKQNASDDQDQAVNNVSVVDGTQIITINAKGGYSPDVTSASAGMPTIIKVATQGTFDCSSALTIPSIGYSAYLPPSGVTEIPLPAQQTGTVLRGICAMGMYNFSVNFN